MNGAEMDGGGAVGRLLSVGEVFDRALTMYVGNWRTFSVLAALLVLPDAVLYYLQSKVIVASSSTAAGPPLDVGQVWTVMNGGGTFRQYPWAIVWVLVAWSLFALVAYPAFLRGARMVIENRQVRIASSIAIGLQRFGKLLGVLGFWIVLALPVTVSAMALLVVPVIIVAGAMHSAPTALGIGIVVVIVVVFALADVAFHIPLHGRFSSQPRTRALFGIFDLLLDVFGADKLEPMLLRLTDSPIPDTVLNLAVNVPLLTVTALGSILFYIDARLRQGVNVPAEFEKQLDDNDDGEEAPA